MIAARSLGYRSRKGGIASFETVQLGPASAPILVGGPAEVPAARYATTLWPDPCDAFTGSLGCLALPGESPIRWRSTRESPGLITSICIRRRPSSVRCRHPFRESYTRHFCRKRVASHRQRGSLVVPFARVVTLGAVITSDDYLIGELSNLLFALNAAANPLCVVPRLPALRRFDGTGAAIDVPGAHNCFHWLFDALPRLKLLEECAISFDCLVASLQTPCQRETLTLLGVDVSKATSIKWAHLEFDRLLVPTLPGCNGNPPALACTFLRQRLLHSDPGAGTAHRRLYISRSNVRRRRIINEAFGLAAAQRSGLRVGRYR